MGGVGRSVLVFFFVLSVLGFPKYGVVLAEPPMCYYQNIFNFGDSNSATGTSLPSPYGKTFFGQPSGRASDGRLIIDFTAERLRLPYLNPYSESAGNNYKNGVNFAAAGATIRPRSQALILTLLLLLLMPPLSTIRSSSFST
ncbi:hypothetical protein H6P81_010396 [Aristolochia fimbriata]|uniref:GDSL esterase/lipase n=1 Tax=Aristolochia fimbriata TaxID=158543 RepID=A0AAV7ERI7_ARIFI|nr:hypothetical protein H6P81_010396 [Aristolochia fimbriata]